MPTRPSRRRFWASAAAAALPAAEPVAAAPARPPRWGIGLELSPFSSPAAHTGVPAGTLRLPVAMNVRRELGPHTALSLGIGGPAASLGLSGWAGLAVSATVLSPHHGLLALELYGTPGALLGFAGPDFIARHSDAFPGFPYIYSGPLTFATRRRSGCGCACCTTAWTCTARRWRPSPSPRRSSCSPASASAYA